MRARGARAARVIYYGVLHACMRRARGARNLLRCIACMHACMRMRRARGARNLSLRTNQLVLRCAPGMRQMPWFECRKLDSDFGRVLRTSASRILAIYMRVSGV